MPAESIGALEFIRLDGEIAPPGIEVEEISRPFVDGRAFRRQHVRATPTTLMAVTDVANQTDANAFIVDALEMRGTVQDIVFRTLTYSDCLIVDVQPLNRTTCSVAVGGINNGKIIIVLQFSVVYVGEN